MKTYFIVSNLLIAFSFRLFAQNTPDNPMDSSSMNSLSDWGINIEHYNLADTTENDFAAYLINANVYSHRVRMEELKEIPLTHPNQNELGLFRILSLPSFNHPICFTIINKKDQKYLTWSIGRGSGGYEPRGIKKRGKTKISESDWSYFKQLIDINSLDTLPLASYLPMNDGTSWSIEKNTQNMHKMYFTNAPSAGIEDGFALLMHISRVKNDKTIHFFNGAELRFFDKKNRKINLDGLSEKVILHLNSEFSEKLQSDDYCFDWDIYIKINSKERVKSVRYIPYLLPHRSLAERLEYFADNFEDRKFRKEVKNSMKKVKFPEFDLSRSIWVPVYVGCNKEKRILEFNRY